MEEVQTESRMGEWENFRVPDVRPQVLRAANWWAENIGPSRLDNGDPESSAVISFLGGLSRQYPVTDDRRAQFREFLALAVDDDLTLNEAPVGSVLRRVTLAVDYNPCQHLYDAAVNAGLGTPSPGCVVGRRSDLLIATGMFPLKVVMKVYADDDRIDLKDGYGAEWVEL